MASQLIYLSVTSFYASPYPLSRSRRNFYRATRCLVEGNVLNLSVILFTGVYVQRGISVHWGRLCPGLVSLSEGVSVWGVSVYREIFVHGASLSGRLPRTVTCGRYASYWNAFLFAISFDCVKSDKTLTVSLAAVDGSDVQRKSGFSDAPVRAEIDVDSVGLWRKQSVTRRIFTFSTGHYKIHLKYASPTV